MTSGGEVRPSNLRNPLRRPSLILTCRCWSGRSPAALPVCLRDMERPPLDPFFGFLSQSSKTKAVAAMPRVTHARTAGADDTSTGRGGPAGFRRELYDSLTAQADALFELTDGAP